MLILRDGHEGVWVKHTYRGGEIELKLRINDPAKLDKIRKKYTTTELVKDDTTGKMVRITEIKQDTSSKLLQEMADYLIEDFKGVGWENGEPMANTSENKVILILLPPLDGEQALFNFILDKASELQTLNEEEQEEQVKNS